MKEDESGRHIWSTKNFCLSEEQGLVSVHIQSPPRLLIRLIERASFGDEIVGKCLILTDGLGKCSGTKRPLLFPPQTRTHTHTKHALSQKCKSNPNYKLNSCLLNLTGVYNNLGFSFNWMSHSCPVGTRISEAVSPDSRFKSCRPSGLTT